MSLFDWFVTHRRSRRLAGYDYASPGWYFVTICADRRLLFGDVRGGLVGLSAVGCIAHEYLMAIPNHFPRAILDARIVMPNHVHAVIEIGADDAESVVATGHAPSLHTPTLGNIVGSYKSAVTRAARHIDPSFGWQPRFHDHVIRSERALNPIRRYIAQNPAS